MEMVITFCITVSTLIAVIVTLFKRVSELKASYLQVTGAGKIIGVVNCWPEELCELPEFTSYRKCLFSPFAIKVLRCRSISYALRHCDFVVARCADDPKIVNPDDHIALQALKT